MVERAFSIQYDLMRAMFNGSKIAEEDPIKNLTWAECASTSVFLHNLIMKGFDTDQPRYELIYKKRFNLKQLKVFVQMGVVKSQIKFKQNI